MSPALVAAVFRRRGESRFDTRLFIRACVYVQAQVAQKALLRAAREILQRRNLDLPCDWDQVTGRGGGAPYVVPPPGAPAPGLLMRRLCVDV